jgi:hypothetical protein
MSATSPTGSPTAPSTLGGLTPPTRRERRGPRLLWRIAGTLVTLFLLGMALLQLVGLLAYNVRDVNHRVDAAGIDRLDLDIDSGSVEVIGVEATTISLTGTIRSGLVQSTHREGVQGAAYVVTGECPDGPASNHCDTEYRIEVPQDLAVHVRVGDGSVTLRDLRGEVDASTSNSVVRAEGLSGAIRLHTSNDEIVATGISSPRSVFETSNDRVRAEFDAAPSSVEVVTSNDRVEVVVPDTPSPYAVRVRTSNGSQRIDVRTDPSSDRTIDVRTSNDDVSVSYPPA